MRKLHWSALSFFLLVMLSIELGSAEEIFIIAVPEVGDSANILPRPHLRMAKTLFQEVAYEANINHQAQQETVVFLRTESGYLLASRNFLKQSRVVVPPNVQAIEYEGDYFVPINQLQQTNLEVDEQRGEVKMTLPAATFNATQIESRKPVKFPPQLEQGAFLNYDLFAQKDNIGSQFDGRFELGVFNHYGVGISSMLANSFNGQEKLIRLDSNWTVDQPENLASWRYGDSINRGGSVGRPIRFGGIQFSTNFATQPDFISFPQFGLNGSAALPSTVDLYINNIKTFSQQVAPGPFSINNLPLLTGSGEARLVVRDLFGREQLITQPYYASRSVLRKGLNDYSYEAGFERFSYGLVSNDYRDFFASATQRYGWSDNLTIEAHGEIKAQQQTASAASVWLIPRIGIVDSTVALSTDQNRGAGQSVSAGFERQAVGWSYGVRTQLANKGFSQLGLSDSISVPSRMNTMFVAWNHPRFGSFGVNYIDQENREVPSAKLLNLNYSKTVFDSWFLNVNAFKNIEDSQGYTLSINLIKAIDERTSATAMLNRSRGYSENTVQVQRSLPVGEGVGYRVLAGQGDLNQTQAGLSAQNDVGTYSVEAAQTRGENAYRATVSGGVILSRGNVLMTRRIGDAFGVVDVSGYPNVKVYAENQLIGKTDSNGLRAIPNLRSYQSNMITIDPTDIPFDSQLESAEVNAVPYYRSGAYVKFPIDKEKAATLRVLQKDQTPVPAGALFEVNDSTTPFIVSDDGMLFLKHLKENNHIKGHWQDQLCEVDIAYPQTDDPLPELGEFVCQ
ncbi:fimbria/pilus outer membrane usher protein [Methyloradius palustris]|nr:fimbria/pilus outer membrane usher protein [Methyloradius palustris]